MSELTLEVKRLRNELSLLNSDVLKAQNNVREISGNINIKQEELDYINSLINSKKRDLADVDNKLNMMISSYNDAVSILPDLISGVDELEKYKSDLSSYINEKTAEVVKNNNLMVKGELNRIKSIESDLVKRESSVTEKERFLKEVQEDIRNQERILSAKINAMITRENNLRLIEEKLDIEKKNNLQVIESLNNAKESAEFKEKLYSKKLNEVESKINHLNDLDLDIKNREQKLLLLKQQIDSSKDEVDNKLKEIEDKKRSLDKERQGIEDMRKQIQYDHIQLKKREMRAKIENS